MAIAHKKVDSFCKPRVQLQGVGNRTLSMTYLFCPCANRESLFLCRNRFLSVTMEDTEIMDNRCFIISLCPSSIGGGEFVG